MRRHFFLLLVLFLILAVPLASFSKTIIGNKALQPAVGGKNTVKWTTKTIFKKKVTLQKKLVAKRKAVFNKKVEIKGQLTLGKQLQASDVQGVLTADSLIAGDGLTITQNENGTLTLSIGFTAGSGVTITDDGIETVLGTTVDSAEIQDATIVAGDISSSAGIALSQLEALPAGQVVLGNSNNVATATAVSGDATVSSSGVISLGTGVVTSAKIVDDTISAADITAGAVASSEIQDAAIVAGDIADSAITSAKIFNGTIATSDLADGVLSADSAGRAKLADDFFDIPSTVDAKFEDGVFPGDKIQDETVTGSKLVMGSVALGRQVRGYATVTYNHSPEGGAIGTQEIGGGTLQLPANTIIVNAYYKVNSTPTSATNAATLKFYIENSSGDLMTATTVNNAALAAGAWKQLTPNYNPTNFITTTATRGLYMTVANEALTAGSVSIIIEYMGITPP